MKKALSLVSTLIGGMMIVSAQIVAPTVASQKVGDGGALLNLLSTAQTLVNRLVPFAIGLAVVVFFWFLIKFIIQGSDSPEKKTASMQGMGYSILALFVMVSIWGIIGLVGSTLGVGQGGSVPTPGIPTGPEIKTQ